MCLASSSPRNISDELTTSSDSSNDNIILDFTGKHGHSTILDFYQNYDENLIRFIKGHLFIEFSMDKILKKAIRKNVYECTFFDKIVLLFDNNLIDSNEKTLLVKINKVRNRIAHRLDYILTFDTVFELVDLSAKAGVDYSDETIFKNKKLSKEWYGIEGILDELFPNTFCHLLFRNEKYFGHNELDYYMC